MKKFITKLSLVAVTIGSTSIALAGNVTGYVKIDGSSTVFPITEAVAEEFGAINPRVRVTVGVSGTGGGFKKFSKNEVAINDASRAIKPKEAKKLSDAGIEYLEIPVAFDGLSVVINPKNDWATSMTTAELKKIWEPGSKVTTWKQVNSSWPDEKIILYGPGTDSGTFDYFTKVINGKTQRSRADFTKSEDDNVLAIGVSGDKNALGYFGYAYYKENRNKLTAVAISHKGRKAVSPSPTTINNNSYAPLSRPLYIYVNKKSLKDPATYAFVEFYLTQGPKLAAEVGYVALPDSSYKKSLALIKKAAAREIAYGK